jgi:hypothetical protein
MVFYFEMACLMDDDVLDVFGWEVNEIEVQRNFLIMRAGSSFGSCFSDGEFLVGDAQFFAVGVHDGGSIFFQNRL